MDACSHDFNFDYFYDFKDALSDIDDLIQKSRYTTIIVFVDEHGSKGKFS